MGTEQRSELKMWGIILGIGLLLVVLGAVFGLPLIEQFIVSLEPGVDIKTAATWSFGVTVVMFVLFAIVAGDGLLGEIQFMLGGFFLFFAIITLLIAWVF
ncbi:MAG: hypothetical protein QNJ78_06300 [Gammaproteobacteria bacterium]|nr:hypothetical protein [Gammaproteobacteria bacterium]